MEVQSCQWIYRQFKFKVTGYPTYHEVNNSMEDTIKYYATEYMNGEKRYDYAMINFDSDEGMAAT